MVKIVAFIASFLVSAFTWGQWSRQPIQNYTSKDYGVQYSNYIHAVVCDDNGFVYAGSAYGVLQFDGYRWNFIHVKAGTYVTSLAYHNGYLFVGCTNDFGYLKANKNGIWQYISLADTFQISLSNAIWKIFAVKDKIYFQTDEAIYVYDNKSITPIKPETSYHLAFQLGESLIVRERSKGLLSITTKDIKQIPHSQLFADTGVFAVLPFKKNSKLIITQEAGIFKWENGNFEQCLSSSQKDFLIGAMIIGAKRLDDGNIALYTLKKGVIVLDTTLNVIAKYSSTQGLLSDEVHDLAQDNYGNLWLATQKGVSRVQYPSAISYFNEKSGLPGNVLCIKKHEEKLYVGSTDGLFVLEKGKEDFFYNLPEIKGKVWAVDCDEKSLWVAGDNGVWKIEPSKAIKQLSKEPYLSLVRLPELHQWLALGTNGSAMFDETNNKVVWQSADLKMDAYGAVAIKDNRGYEVWVGTKNQGVFQFIFNQNKPLQTIQYRGIEDGLPDDWISPYLCNGKVYFATPNGFLRFISPDEINKMAGNNLDNEVRGYFDVVNFPKNKKDKSITAFYCYQKKVFVAIENYLYFIGKDSIANHRGFKTIDLGRLNCLYVNDDEIWLGADDGLARVDLAKLNVDTSPKPTFTINSIEIANDSVLGYFAIHRLSKPLVFPYNLNTIKINLSSLYIDNHITLQYSWLLKGSNDETFSSWDSNPQILLTNLKEGDYTLIIRAKNANDVLSKEQCLRFKILPPWYRSWWAYMIYVAFAIFFIYLIIYFNSRRLVAKNKKLEEIVKIRTQEVVEQKEEIEHQKTTIEHILKDLNDSISYAQRIQEVLLPSREMIESMFHDSMVLYKPRNIVSGDFYWAAIISFPNSQTENKLVIIAVADCTGHGVPGAFMSMLGISFLNDIVKKKEITQPSEILNMLRAYIIEALKQSIDSGSQKDGMDISMLTVNMKTLECQWAGANNPLYIVKGADTDTENGLNKLIEIKPDKMPIAIYPVMEPFTNHTIQLEKGDALFLFSDGYADQFGGPKGKKFMYKSFKELLIQHSDKKMNELKDILDNTIIDWMKNEEQNDDITVLGIKI